MHIDTTDFAKVNDIIAQYFEGLHHGDIDKLLAIFHPDAWLKAPDSRRSLQTWLKDVASRPTPAEQTDTKGYTILAIDIVHDQAMVKVSCPLFTFHYIDFLGLLKENGQWRIVNKMYTDIAHLGLAR